MSPKRGSTHVRFVFIQQTKFAGSELYSQKQLFDLTSTEESFRRRTVATHAATDW
jgi:hypothetical protein